MATPSLSAPSIPKTRPEQVEAAMSRLALELCALNVKFAVILYDPQEQKEETMTVSLASNVPNETAADLFKVYLEGRTCPSTKVRTIHEDSALNVDLTRTH